MDDIPRAEQSCPAADQSVKSNAIVKYSSVSSPALFATLRSNTDIKRPPSNWLSSFAESYGLNYASPVSSSGFSSFRMANTFPDCVGQVDVVSDAENIKKLLKIPYCDNPVSMMVHRVENTLLIDDFDIHKHLLSRAEDEWTWLRKYFLEHILSTLNSKDKFLTYRERSRNALQQKSLVSKFLHHSLAEDKEPDLPREPAPLPITTRGPCLPEPIEEETLPASDHKFTRNVVWTFEDIQMLLGTDMPIFGGPNRPCISLRLRDANKQISVLTGIDYWLDNLMSNVPEVVMCYHLDGIVQKYELLKTEDLPNLRECRFSPKIIRDVAQNILSFLKANATKAGHTYWLFKGTNEDAVKLYDLTSLCSDSMDEKDENPFTIPVGMLLYRVARNMKVTGSPSQYSTIRTLLKNCLSLLSKEKYPQIVTSVHFMLSDIYIPRDTDPDEPSLHSLCNLELPDMDERTDDDDTNKSPITSLSISQISNSPKAERFSRPQFMASTVEERCRLALQHVCDGLDCLQYLNSKTDQASKKTEQKEEPKMAKPFEAIPMPYSKSEQTKYKAKEPKKGNDKKLISDEKEISLKAVLHKSNGIPSFQKPEFDNPECWKVHLSNILTEKAYLVYSILVVREMESKQYLKALHHIRGVIRCCGENPPLVGLMLSHAGDCIFNLATTQPTQIEESDEYPLVVPPGPIHNQEELELAQCPQGSPESVEVFLEASINCYRRSMELYPTNDTFKRAGNAYNTIGRIFTGKAECLLRSAEGFDKDQFMCFLHKAEEMLDRGLKCFEHINDTENSALLISNKGRLYRIRAVLSQSSDSIQDINTAIDYYERALATLESRKKAPKIWDLIYWELSTTLFTYATMIQDNAPPPTATRTKKDIEREVIYLLQRALKYCDVETQSSKQPLYQYRAATLYHKIAGLHHSVYRARDYDETKLKQIYQLCHINYNKALHLYAALELPQNMLRVQLEKISLCEYIAEVSKGSNTKKKHLLRALEFVAGCKPALILIEDKVTKGDDSDPDKDETNKLLDLLQDRFHFVLKSLIKILTTEGKDKNNQVAQFKKIYGSSLTKSPGQSLSSHLLHVLDLIPEQH